MTADIQLLPLPEKSEIDRHLPTGVRVYGYTSDDMRGYARACIAHAAAAKDAEIEALRDEVERWKVLYLEWLNKTEWVQQTGRPSDLGRHRADVMRLRLEQVESSAERLAEALRHLRNHSSVNSHQIELIDAALRPAAEQEGRESFWPKLPVSGGPDWTGHD